MSNRKLPLALALSVLAGISPSGCAGQNESEETRRARQAEKLAEAAGLLKEFARDCEAVLSVGESFDVTTLRAAFAKRVKDTEGERICFCGEQDPGREVICELHRIKHGPKGQKEEKVAGVNFLVDGTHATSAGVWEETQGAVGWKFHNGKTLLNAESAEKSAVEKLLASVRSTIKELFNKHSESPLPTLLHN